MPVPHTLLLISLAEQESQEYFANKIVVWIRRKINWRQTSEGISVDYKVLLHSERFDRTILRQSFPSKLTIAYIHVPLNDDALTTQKLPDELVIIFQWASSAANEHSISHALEICINIMNETFKLKISNEHLHRTLTTSRSHAFWHLVFVFENISCATK